MDKLEQEKGHLFDLAAMAERTCYPTASDFYGVSDLSSLHQTISSGKLANVPFILLGGYENAERVRIVFVPEEYASFSGSDFQDEFISCYHVEPKSFEFATPLTHRDVLGALMSLGIKRESVGDILVDGSVTEFFILPSLEKEIEASLASIRNNKVVLKKILCEESTLKPKFKEEHGSISSLRLDAIIGSAFHLSREQAKHEILAKRVFATSLANPKPDSTPSIGDHITLVGKGKIIYRGESGTSRKGKIIFSYTRYV